VEIRSPCRVNTGADPKVGPIPLLQFAAEDLFPEYRPLGNGQDTDIVILADFHLRLSDFDLRTARTFFAQFDYLHFILPSLITVCGHFSPPLEVFFIIQPFFSIVEWKLALLLPNTY
jgi:hypothetical protein